MPEHESKALYKWARKFSEYGPLLEIGTYCGKSSMFLSEGARRIISMFILLIITWGQKSIKSMKSILI